MRSNVLQNAFFAKQATHSGGAQCAKIAEKVHKPPLGVNVINFELNGFNAFIWVRHQEVIMH